MSSILHSTYEQQASLPDRICTGNRRKVRLPTIFGVTSAARKGPVSSDCGANFGFAKMSFAQSSTKECVGSSSSSLQTSMAALQQAFKPFFRFDSHRSSDSVCASIFDHSALVRYGALHLLLTESL